ncbi:MAG: tRNA-dependent cyclodipeptide synthase [Patescibacteria group bacterium]|nr:tRNA-dependent cyclodipeptide synthase [Patescibacteria group bacterium]MDE1966300.1 tRNA-dependent cyclodipeptide synthase [Patescibacteria group bacterium]
MRDVLSRYEKWYSFRIMPGGEKSFVPRAPAVSQEKEDSGLERKLAAFNAEAEREGWKMDILSGPTSKIFEQGLKDLDSREEMLLALCLNNSYYKRENIYRMLKFSLAFSKSVQVFTTDGPARHNYRAFGKDEAYAERKTRLERNHLRNLTNDALGLINKDLPPEEQKTVAFMDWERIYADPEYRESLDMLKKLYESNEEFRSDINSITTQVLLSRVGINKDTEAVLEEGIQYVLEEVAFIASYMKLSEGIKPKAEHGKDGFNYIYYESWPVLEKLVNGDYDGQPKDGIGFVIAKITQSDT